MMDVLIMEDNREIGGMLLDFLTAEGFSACLACSGEEGLALFRQQGAKLVVLDVMLPGMDGFAVCQAIRQDHNTPLIIVSARGEKADQLTGLQLGADDYIEKPYDIDLLLAKIRGIFLRRYQMDLLVWKDLKLDKAARQVTRAGVPLRMTGKELELLQILLENPGKTLSKEFLFSKVWGCDSFSEQQTLTVHIKWLREKIEEDPKKPKHILTVWGVGYRFEE